MASPDVLARIPHRPPFLFVDEIVSLTRDAATARFYADPGLAFFAGHYPGEPIMPGVLLSEAVFQTGALLLSERNQAQSSREATGSVPVLTKISEARFRSPVRPGETLTMEVRVSEESGSFLFLEGKVTSGSRRVLNVSFCVAQIKPATTP